MMKDFNLVDVVCMVCKEDGIADIKKLAYYIEAYAELDTVYNPLVLLDEAMEQAEEKTVNALLFEVFEGIIESLCIKYGVDSGDFDTYINGCASTLDYVGDNDEVLTYVYNEL